VWIGSGWCPGDGPWRAEPDADGVATFTLGDAGTGVNRKLPHLGNARTGVNRTISGDRLEWITEWFLRLQDELAAVRVACGDWERICSPGTMTLNGVAAVVMDPPYSQTGAVYANDCDQVSGKVRAWCAANGDNPGLRIVLCGHDGEHHDLEAIGWRCVSWEEKSAGGYQGGDDRERLWMSPHCETTESDGQMFLF